MNEDELTRTYDLVRQAQSGDDEARNKILERYCERVRRLIRPRLGQRLRNMVDSADILQETLMAAVQRFDRFEMRDEASMLNWLARLAERQIMDKADYQKAAKRDIRRQRPRGSQEQETAIGDPLAELAADITRPPDRASKDEEHELIEQCLGELPERYREIIMLRNYSGLDWKSIAEKTGRASDNAARMMHTKAMLELSKLMRARTDSSTLGKKRKK